MKINSKSITKRKNKRNFNKITNKMKVMNKNRLKKTIFRKKIPFMMKIQTNLQKNQIL